jgi:membrane-bound lytic murein transglycosylase B
MAGRGRGAKWHVPSALIAAWLASGCSAMAQDAGPATKDFTSFLSDLRREAVEKGISPATLDRALAVIQPDPHVIDLLGRQPEHERTAGQYIAIMVTPERFAAGRSRLAEHAELLSAIESRYGVDRHVLTAIWGVETRFGQSMGDRPVVQSLATLAHADPRRPQFWRGELIAALRILQNGDVTPDRMTGSWAGAMGHAQFMPSTYLRHAVDHDGDGRRDIWGAPGDALASAAAYLAASGWARGQPWGFPVVLPEGFDLGHSAPGQARRAADWQKVGVSNFPGTPWPATTGDLALILPAGAAGPAFLLTDNFRALLRYNAATSYALSVGLLGDALAAGAPADVRWPAGDRALSRAEREELQQRLSALGHDAGTVDGILGTQTRFAIRAFQKRLALPEDGHPSPALLERLRAAGN